MGKKNSIGIITALVVVLVLGTLTLIEIDTEKERALTSTEPDLHLTLYVRSFLEKHNIGNYIESEPEFVWSEGYPTQFRIDQRYRFVKRPVWTTIVQAPYPRTGYIKHYRVVPNKTQDKN